MKQQIVRSVERITLRWNNLLRSPEPKPGGINWTEQPFLERSNTKRRPVISQFFGASRGHLACGYSDRGIKEEQSSSLNTYEFYTLKHTLRDTEWTPPKWRGDRAVSPSCSEATAAKNSINKNNNKNKNKNNNNHNNNNNNRKPLKNHPSFARGPLAHHLH